MLKNKKEIQEELLEQIIENDNLEEYRDYLIESILKYQTEGQYTKNDLQKKSSIDLGNILESIN